MSHSVSLAMHEFLIDRKGHGLPNSDFIVFMFTSMTAWDFKICFGLPGAHASLRDLVEMKILVR